jgi:photosystem II stability/assembly factor-like uncharacterized protein
LRNEHVAVIAIEVMNVAGYSPTYDVLTKQGVPMQSGMILTLLSFSFFLHTPACLYAQSAWRTVQSGTTADLYVIQFMDALHGYAAGQNGAVIRTSDGGLSWRSVGIPTTFPVRALSFISFDHGWAVTGDVDHPDNSGGMWETTDGGESWTNRQYNSTRARLGVSFVSDVIGWACGARNGPLDITATKDGGQTFGTQSSASIFGWTYGIKGLSPEVVWAAGGTYFPAVSGFLLYSTNGGASWHERSMGVLPFFFAIDFPDMQHGYAAGESGGVYATTDGGQSWRSVSVNTTSALRSVSFASAQHGWVCGEDGSMFLTTDGGQSWSDHSMAARGQVNGVFSRDLKQAWAVGEAGGVWEYADGTSFAARPTSKAFTVHVYPLPSQSHVTFRFDGGEAPLERHSLRIRDILGVERLRLDDVDGRAITLTTEMLGIGVFFFESITNTGNRSTGKFMLLNP